MPGIKRNYFSGRNTNLLSPIVNRMSKSEIKTVKNGLCESKKQELERVTEEIKQFS